MMKVKKSLFFFFFYVSKALLGPKPRYALLEQLILALLIVARKLHPYFQAHSIIILIALPIIERA